MSAVPATVDFPAPGGAGEREVLACMVHGERYGIDLAEVAEVRELRQVTRVPHAAAFVRGIVNLRGALVPVVDLALLIGFADPVDLRGACAVVLGDEDGRVAFAVDDVSDVVVLDRATCVPGSERGIGPGGLRIDAVCPSPEGSVVVLAADDLLRGAWGARS